MMQQLMQQQDDSMQQQQQQQQQQQLRQDDSMQQQQQLQQKLQQQQQQQQPQQEDYRNIHTRRSGDFTISYAGDFEYEIIDKIGGGPTSELFLVRTLNAYTHQSTRNQQQQPQQQYQQQQQPQQQQYVLKAIKKSFLHEELQLIYDNEVQMLQRVQPHAHVITLVKALGATTLTQGCCSKNRYCLVLEHGAVGSLKNLLDRRIGGFSEATARFFFRQMVSALAHVHAHGLFHADVKVDNFVVSDAHSLTVKLIDFGLCREDSRTQAFYDGSLECQSPEIVLREAYSGWHADVFALGVTLLYLLRNQYPWHKVGLYDFCYQHIVRGEYAQFWAKQAMLRNEELSAECKDLIQRMLALSDRPTADEIARHAWLAAPDGEDVIERVRQEVFEQGVAASGISGARVRKNTM